MARRASASFDFDVIVVGGGPAGLGLTALLATQGIKTLCLDREAADAQTQAHFDGRTTAISWGSQKIIDAAGAWDAMIPDASPILNIQILDGDSPILLDFDCAEVAGEPFGWIIENRLLRRALMKRVASLPHATHITPAIVADFAVDESGADVILKDGQRFRARLIIGADGRNSFTREWIGIGARAWSYKQRAVVCTVTHERPHDGIAVEHFHPAGPFAILPMTDDKNGAHRSSVVWTEHGDESASALHFGQVSFDTALTARFPARYGAVKQVEKRFSFPLALTHAHDYIGPRMALIAEAAHAIHPIAGQGLNLGYRDIAVLTELITDAKARSADIGGADLLQTYERKRRVDNMAMAGATDMLNRLFSNDIAPARAARRIGLRIVARVPVAKRFFMSQAMGAAGILPGLISDRKKAINAR